MFCLSGQQFIKEFIMIVRGINTLDFATKYCFDSKK